MSADLTRLIHIASSRFFQVIGRSPEELWLGPMMQKTLCEEVYYYFPSTPPPIAAVNKFMGMTVRSMSDEGIRVGLSIEATL